MKKMHWIKGLWDLNTPTDLLQEILSRLGLKENIRASLVCKTWCEVSVSVRKFQPRPWLFYPQQGLEDVGDYILYEPSSSQKYNLNFPELRKLDKFSYSRDGWLLVSIYEHEPSALFLLNPFTRVRIYLPTLPDGLSGHRIAFSAAPTSSSCLVISFNYTSNFIFIYTWGPGETVWTTYCFENQLRLVWDKCHVLSHGLFYCLSSNIGFLGVFDPSKATWNKLPVKPYPVDFGRPIMMTEHEGDIFLITTPDNKNPLVVKLNQNKNVWEETEGLGGLTVFASLHVSLTRAGLPSEVSNTIYTSHYRPHDMYYSLGDEKSSRPPSMPVLPYRSVWVDPPQNVNL